MNLRTLFLTAIILVVQSAFAQKHIGSSWAKVKAEGSGTLDVVYYELPGLIQEVGGKPRGLCVDLLEDFTAYVKKKYNKEVAIRYVGKEAIFANFLSTVEHSDNLLGIANVAMTEERRRIFKFTPSFLSNPLVIITHKIVPNIGTITDLKTLSGYSAEVIDGSAHARMVNKIKQEFWPDLKVAYGQSSQDIVKKIATHPHLFTVMDLTDFISASRNNLPVKKQLKAIGRNEDAFIMSKRNDWDVLWNEFLTDDYRKGSTYRKSIADNLGASFLNLISN
jgi:membrane-bound lytic murein transglycosylase MltF